MDPEIAAALIGPIITAGLAAFAVGLREWRTRRQSAGRQQDALDRALQEVAFIDAWVTAHAKVTGAAGRHPRVEQALADLDRAYAVMAGVHAAAETAPRPRTTVERLRSLLLLNVHRTRAKVARAFYYVFLVAGLLFVTIGITEGFDPVAGGVYLNILVAMFFTLFSFSPAIATFWLARLLDRPGRVTAPTPPPPPLGSGPAGPSGPTAYGGYPGAPPPGPGSYYPPPR